MESQPDRDDILDRCSSDPDSPVFLEVPATHWQQKSHVGSRRSAIGVSSCIPRYRLPSEDDDAFTPDIVYQSRGTKRSRLDSDDDVFFQPRARLTGESTPLYPRARLPSDSDSSSVFYPRHRRRFRERQTAPLVQRQRDSSSIQLDSSQYTADDTPDPAFKTPYSRPPRRQSSEASSAFPNSTRSTSDDYPSHSTRLSEPPRVTRTPFAWISPNLSGVSPQDNVVPMSSNSITDVRQRLFRQVFSFSSASSDISLVKDNMPFNPTSEPTTSSPKDIDGEPNLAESILSEEMRPDSGFSSLPSFDGKTCFNQYKKRFEDRLVDVMVNILAKVEPIPDVPGDAKRSKTVKSTHSISDVSPFPAPLGVQSPEEISVYSAAIPASSSPVDDVYSLLPPTHPQSATVSGTPSPISASFSNISDISTDFLDFLPDAPPPSPCSSVFRLSGSRSSNSSDVLSSKTTSSPQLPFHHDVKLKQPSHFVTSVSSDSTPSSAFRHHVEPTTKRSRECKICHKILASASNLRIHMRIHTGERPYLCLFCFRDFRDRTTFRRHERLHTGKPFGCEACSKAFVTRSDLRHHINKHHSS